MRNGDYRRRYGITLAQFNSMVVTQGGVCAICETTKPGGRDGRFNVDHCHDTGAVRGLLCWNCNTALGKFKDDAGLLRKALAYLNLSTSETHPQPTPGMQ